MANSIPINEGTPIVWADVGGDFGDSPIAGTNQITLVSLANAAARQGVKVGLGDPRAEIYEITLRVELDVAATSGLTVDLYMGSSPHTTAGTANPGGLTGADAAYTGTAGDSLADSLKQLDYIGSLICTADAATVVQQQSFKYSPANQWVMPVVFNQSGQAFEGDDIEMSIIMIPIPPEVQ